MSASFALGMPVRHAGTSALLFVMGTMTSGPGAAQSASKEIAVNEDVAQSLTKFGLTVVVGSAEVISNSGKSSISSADAQVLGKDLTALVDRYKQSTREAQYAASLVQTVGEVVITTTQVGATMTGVGALPATAIASVARYGNDRFSKFIADEGMDQAKGMFSAGLQTMTQADQKQFDAYLTAGNAQAAADLFDARTQKLSTMKGVLKDDPTAAAAADKLILQTIQQTTSAALIQSGMANAAVQDIEGKLAKHVQATNDFAKDASKRIDALGESSKELNDAITGVNQDLGSLLEGQKANAFQLSMVQDVLFEQQTPSTKLAMLNGGARPGLTGEARATVVKYLQVEVQKQQILAKASSIVTAAADVNTIMTNLNIKDQRLSDAVRYGSVANAALAQAFQGNYLGAVASVSGLFGGGGEDPNKANFQRVFAELAHIREQLDAVINLQKKTLESIELLSRQLAEVEQRLHAHLDNIDFELKVLSSASFSQLWSDYGECMTAWEKRGDSEFGFDDESLQFRSSKGLTAYTNRWGNPYAFQCSVAIRNMFSQLRSAGDFENPIRLEFAKLQAPEAPPPGEDHAITKPEMRDYIEQVYSPSANLLLQGWQDRAAANPGWGSIAGAFALLSTPSPTGTELLERVAKLDTRPTPLRACSSPTLLGNRAQTLLCSDSAVFDPAKHGGRDKEAEDRAGRFLRDPIVREQAGYLIRWTGLVSGPSNFAPGGAAGAPLTLDQLAATTQGSSFSYGRDLLFSGLSLADITVAQQSMIYGDLTAYFVFSALWNAGEHRFNEVKGAVRETAKKLLDNPNNLWLRRNVAMLILMSARKNCTKDTCPSNDLGYELALRPLHDSKVPVGAAAGAPAVLQRVDASTLASANEVYHALFDLPADLQLVVFDLPKTGEVITRDILLKAPGFEVPVPTLEEWRGKLMSYPPEMLKRVHEREVLAQRWADYAALDGLDDNAKVRLVRAMSGGVGY
jgi:hypothetical protein